MSKPIVLCEDGKVFFYKSYCNKEEISVISSYLKTISMQIKFTKLYEIYKLDDYSLIYLVLENNNKEKFINFIENNSEYMFPKKLLDKIENIELNIKEVKLELGESEVILKVIKGDLDFIQELNKDKKIINKNSNGIYNFKNNQLHKVIKNLNKNKAIIRLPKCKVNSLIDINENKIVMRYYQEQAFEYLKDKTTGILIMPIISGKNYVALNIVSYIKKKTLIFCNGKEQLEIWKNQLMNLLNININRITVVNNESFKENDFVICNYEYINKNSHLVKELIDNQWGVVIYDDAHKAVTDKVIDILLIKSERKFALASSLERSDGKEIELISIFGQSIYNISNKELISKMYQKDLKFEKIDIRECNKNKQKVIHEKFSELKDKRIIITAHKIDDVELIASNLDIDFLNKNTLEDNREILVNRFNSRIINAVCCSNLIEKYRFTDVDVMIVAGYRGAGEIEENFRVGTLISTKDKLEEMKEAIIIYLYGDEHEEKIVNVKIGYLKKWGLI